MPFSDLHAEIKIRNHVLMLGDENPQMGACAPPLDGKMPSSSVMLYVENVDAIFRSACGNQNSQSCSNVGRREPANGRLCAATGRQNALIECDAIRGERGCHL